MFKRVKQKIALLGLSAILLCGMIYSPANAAEPLTNQEQSEALYDMKKGGTQEFDVITDNGEKAHVTITEIPNTTKVANGTYRIQYDLKGCWVAGF